MKQTRYQTNQGKNSCKSRSLRLPIKQSIKKLTIGATTAGLGLLTLTLTIFPTANQLASALTINSLSQTSGSLAGGNEITIKGEGFSKTAIISSVVKNNLGALALTNDGKLYNWGIKSVVYSSLEPNCNIPNFNPQKPKDNCIYDPVDITDLFDGETADKIYATGNSFLVITKNNRVFTWGQNYNTVFGDGTSDWSRKPVEITNQFGGDKITDIYCDGGSTVFARGKSGDLYVWGANYYGQLGVPATKVPVNLTKSLRAKNQLADDEDIATATGSVNPVLVTNKHRVLVAGNNISGQLSALVPGSGSQGVYTDITSLFGNEIIIAATPSNRNAIAYLTESGKVLTIGNKYMVGKAVDSNQKTLVDITDEFGGDKVERIYAQGAAFIAETADNRFYIWGGNSASVIIGDDSGAAITTPADVTDKLAPMGNLIVSQTGNQLFGLQNGRLTGLGQNEAWMINGYINSLGKDSAAKLNATPFDITPRLPLLRPLVKSIKFGNTEAKFTVADNNTIKVTAPASADPGKVAVTITDNDGKTITLDNAYEYVIDDTSVKSDKHITPTAPNTGYQR